ncbi:transmembrane protein 14C-like [Ruditapes philippinarum]|uniref:transmembrane protein 14C-like n=1 Tax=Ruditapes philippinarum TaxID=129788 RepID=UPI00295B8408|nr:transmembrane protein 14C-like [Ruditapes philippinarum]
MPADIIGYSYAAIVAGGGVMGYVKSASLPSLAAGLTFGSLAAVGAYQTSQNRKDIRLSLGTSATLMCVMGFRFIKTRQFMPAGFIGILSHLMVLKCAFAISDLSGILGGEK